MMWENEQNFESSWWGTCANTFGEETKQLSYSFRMGLKCYNIDGKWPCYDLQGKSIIDLGGGPSSLTLKVLNAHKLTVVDPCNYPDWVRQRYQCAGIEYIQCTAENYMTDEIFDECWIYNVLQHVQDPQLIIKNAKKYAKIIRLFEWIDMPAHEGHPHELKETSLNLWLGIPGQVETLTGENTCHGKAYYGVFPCDSTF